MNIFIYGSDSYRSQEHLKRLINKFKQERDPRGLNVIILDCEKNTPAEIIEQLLTGPFLAEKKLIVLKKMLSAVKKGEIQEELLTRIKQKNLPENNILIFWEAADKPKTAAAKELWSLLTKEPYSQEFLTLTGPKLANFIKSELAISQAQISQPALNYLINNTNGDSWLINSLIKQLGAYKNGQEITNADVALFLTEKTDDNIFNLVDAVIARQKNTIFAMIKEQYHLGKDPFYILAMLIRQIKILLQIKDEFEKNDLIKSDDLAKKLALHPFVVKKSLPLIKRFTKEQLIKIYQNLLILDTQIKTGLEDQYLLLDLFISKLLI